MSTEPNTCPVKKPQTSSVSKCPVNHKQMQSNKKNNTDSREPPDTVDHFMIRNAPHSATKVIEKTDSKDPHDMIPGMSIPATGRGNSESGDNWLNPSANQLYNALQRKDKVSNIFVLVRNFKKFRTFGKIRYISCCVCVIFFSFFCL